ncbi:type 1 glutamine amidotransferase [Limobrevibacterium gyesilva]|nr:type 1 glutamine amidotransferase [Limobrevibacterium gyesilva]
MSAIQPTVLFVSQWAEPGTYDPRTWCRMPGGDDETAWFRACLDSLGLLGRVAYRAVRTNLGEALPQDLDAIDAVILGGSIASVHDGYEWQARILDWLGRWRATGRPFLGICGGHQLAALALGGSVGRNPAGVTAGSLPVTRTAAGDAHFLFDGFAPDAPFYFGNYDRVETIPPGATVLATRPGLPAAALDHGGNWLSVQFHPELTADAFATFWAREDPAKAALYPPIPFCERMVQNFLAGTGVMQ